ncbi:uncharacterized sugar kinase R08D7.7-like [Bolinopsis microptera]|uniref:uncharacterized sugar kinase R08D7.7-like n=1 Tax=Bolinopsis microptera TaxID=2820187 RepID=UPI003079A0CF
MGLNGMKNVVGIGGCAQQHGTVYTAQGFLAALQTADVSLPLHTQLQDYFTLPLSPIWMDSSTEEYCERLEEKIGSEELCNRTGSRAHARFSVHHIHRMVNESPELYESTERVLLVSNFLGTLLTGKYMAIDFSDGSGMNLLDVFRRSG